MGGTRAWADPAVLEAVAGVVAAVTRGGLSYVRTGSEGESAKASWDRF